MASSEEEAALAPWHFAWVVKHQLAIMGYPKSEGNLRYLREAGVGHLVSLSPEKQPPFELFHKELRWTPLDVLEFEPPTLQQILSFIEISRETLASGKAVGVHCRMGKGRSGVMGACFMVYFYGLTWENAVTHVRLASPGCIETYQQEKAVRSYHDFLRSHDPPAAPPPPTEQQLLQALYDKYNPDTFIPNVSFVPRGMSHPVLERYSSHLIECPTAKYAKRTTLPNRTALRHSHHCQRLSALPPPTPSRMLYFVHKH